MVTTSNIAVKFLEIWALVKVTVNRGHNPYLAMKCSSFSFTVNDILYLSISTIVVMSLLEMHGQADADVASGGMWALMALSTFASVNRRLLVELGACQG